MWYPQFLQSINDYGKKNGKDNFSICQVIESMTHKTKVSDTTTCKINLDNSSVYIHASILGTVHLFFSTAAGFVIDKLGKKTLSVILSTVAAICPMLMYFTSNTKLMLMLFPPILALGELSGNILLTIIMELFPTNFRVTALSISLTFVRIGTSTTNIIFPYLLMHGCLPVLLYLSVIMFISAILISLLPSTENKALQ